jgi:hypothetical protein
MMGLILSDADLTRLSGWVTSRLLKDECDILRPTRVQKPSGGWTETDVVVETTRCAVLDEGGVNAAGSLIADQIGSAAVTKRMLLPRGTDIQEDDSVRVAGMTYSVIGSLDPTSFEVCRRVLIRRTTVR